MKFSASVLAGQFLLGLYFFVPGLMKIAAPADTLAYMQSHGIAFSVPLMWFATAANLIGGAFLMTGRHVKLTAYGFVIYTLLVNFLLHDFWTMTGDQAAHETQNFIKNLGIVAGLLVLAGHAPWRKPFPLQLLKSDKAALAQR